MSLAKDLLVIMAAAFLRALGVGLTGVLLGVYLGRTGSPAAFIGLVVTAGFAGAALATAFVSYRADRMGRRWTLVALAFLSAWGGLGMVFASHPAGILAFAFLGMLNGMGRDRGAALALEQAIVPEGVAPERRTWALAWYNIVLDAGHALGALAAIIPFLLRRRWGIELLTSYKLTWGLYAGLNLLGAVLYLFASPAVELREARANPPTEPVIISPESRKIVAKLAALFGLDGLGGGFLTGALIAYWFFHRFGVGEESLGPLFFAARLINGGSYLVAAWLARRIGLLNTTVFTHMLSSVFLMAVPLGPTLAWAVLFFLARESLVQMDVPTRQSYTVAVVKPEERTYASGVTNVTRNVAWGAGSALAGLAMQYLRAAAPLFIGGSIKMIYDALLYISFRGLKPPEERASASAANTAGSA